MKVSFCTTCKGRLMHLRETLPKNIALASDPACYEFVLLDYNSEDGLGQWIYDEMQEPLRNGLLSYYRTDRPFKFFMAHAKNVAHKLASGEIVCNLDADNQLSRAFLIFLRTAFSEQREEVFVSFDGPGVGGRIALAKNVFLKLGGYNELFEHGWGYEDSEFIFRLNRAGLKRISTLNTSMLGAVLEHSNELREREGPYKEKLARCAALNFQKLAESMAANAIVANAGRGWGYEIVRKNFSDKLFES